MGYGNVYPLVVIVILRYIRDLFTPAIFTPLKEYKNYIQLIHGLIQAESNDLCARSMSDCLRTHPHHSLKVIEEIWGLKTPRKRTCEHPQQLDSTTYILTDQESKLVSRTCGASPQFTSIPLILANIQKSHCKKFQIGCMR